MISNQEDLTTSFEDIWLKPLDKCLRTATEEILKRDGIFSLYSKKSLIAILESTSL